MTPRQRGTACGWLLGLAALASPAQAADRWWTFIGGCSNADWLGMPAGSTNAQGATTCWAASNIGLSGAAVPTAGDSVWLQSTGASDLSVSFATTGRPAFTGRAGPLIVSGTGAGFTGLTMAAALPAATTLQVSELSLGFSGRGQLQQAGGRVVVDGPVELGALAGDVGRYTLEGGALQTNYTTNVGDGGGGEFVQTGGDASLGVMQLAQGSGATASMRVSGGTLRSTALNLAGGGSATLAVSGSGQVSAGTLTVASGSGASRGDATVTGPAARLTLTSLVTAYVGYRGTGTLTVSDGGQMSGSATTLGVLGGSRGEALVAGSGARWSLFGTLRVGGLGSGLLTVGSGGTVGAPELVVGRGGRVLLDDGELALGAASGEGSFEWRTGTLRLGGPGGSTALGSSPLLPAATVLAPQQTLVVTGTLAVGNGLLALSGGTLQADALTLGGGTLAVVGDGSFDVGTVGAVTGHGTVLGAVRGGASSTLVVRDGALTVGQAGRSDGVDVDGTIHVLGQQLVLLDSDGARLGALTRLVGGGRLASANGVVLDTGRTLNFSGSASVEGTVTHRGAIAPEGAGSLTFFDDVSGPGSFAGTIVFRGLYRPTGAAAVRFAGGTLRVDTSGTLVLGIAGLAPGSFARVAGIQLLDVAGAVQLDFAAGVALPDDGASLDLLDFDVLAGTIDPSRITVSGLAAADQARLDFSRLGVDGTLRIAPVPEPAAPWLLLAGLGLLARRRRPGAGAQAVGRV